MKTSCIYMLVDPRTDEIRYVGKTEQRLESRVSAHMADRSNCHKVHWLSQLRSEGVKPTSVVLEDVCGLWPWQLEERYWIAKLKSMGARLTNNTDGGDGVSGVSGESKARMLATWKGRKHSPQTIEKLKAARALRVTSEETKRKMSRSQSGRKITWGDKLAESIRKLSVDQVREVASRLQNGETVTAIAKELGMHRTSISKIKAGTYFEGYRSLGRRFVGSELKESYARQACANLKNATAQMEMAI